MLDRIMDALIDGFKADVKLSDIKNYHKVEKTLPEMSSSISVWVPKQRFKEYDRYYDEVTAEVHLCISINDLNAESGGQQVRILAEEIRLLLADEMKLLGGLIDNSFLHEFNFSSTEISKELFVHLGEAIMEVTYYAGRFRNETDETADEVTVSENKVNR